ncbi:MAG: SPASM domain-containing protein [Deltaproteobacteria bacterium]|nr:SPASM domain-containing protein [Deltaproteobacteria bacterium]
MSENVFQTVVVVVRPTLLCNYSCDYCYISPKNRQQHGWLEPGSVGRLIRVLSGLECQKVTLSWQGGEPTLAGRERLKQLIDAAESEAGRVSMLLQNCLHTNGTLIDSDWASFFAERGFSVGVSIDAYQEANDRHRRWASGLHHVSPHTRAMISLDILRKEGVSVEVTSTLVDPDCLDVDRLYEFYRSLCVERINVEPKLTWTPWNRSPDGSQWLMPYARLLLQLFNRWKCDDENRPRIQYFELIDDILLGGENEACHMSGACWNHIMLQPNGDVFPCDQFGDDPNYVIANVDDDQLVSRLRELPAGPLATISEKFKGACLGCLWYSLCRGGCLYQRLSESSSSAQGGGYPSQCWRSYMFSEIVLGLGRAWPRREDGVGAKRRERAAPCNTED